MKSYQLSNAAAFASKRPVGRGEAASLRELEAASEQLGAGSDPVRTVTEKLDKGGTAKRSGCS